ncbi:hypothetical protein P7K49_017353 [Saguinus oedipus]|uniref:Uncharacterized protein n=1 Tax=Saguinus oedipus TaxID=9490 RepID=A0ABQ9V2P7_SAGOE|nr:hypothetical protein P7K49_017353 [Saguinus oedipus]
MAQGTRASLSSRCCGSLAARGSFIPLMPSLAQRLCLTQPTPPSATHQNPTAAARSPRGCVDGGAAAAETGRNGEEPLSARCGWGLLGRRRNQLCGRGRGHGCWLDARFPCCSEDPRPTRDSNEAVLHGLSSPTAYRLRTVYMCQFLTKIAAGKNLDAQFENDE